VLVRVEIPEDLLEILEDKLFGTLAGDVEVLVVLADDVYDDGEALEELGTAEDAVVEAG
jgi:hypothetical protein